MADANINEHESLTCQRCHQPLILDPSITSLTSAQHSLITSSLPGPSTSALPPASKLASLPPSSREGAEIWAKHHSIPFDASSPHSVAESFILLSDSVFSHAGPSRLPGPPPAGGHLSHHLHEILSRQTPIDHPLCLECASMLQVELQKELDELSRERDAYIAFERGISRNREELKGKRGRRKGTESPEEGLGEYDIEGTEEEWAELTARKKALEKEEKELIRLLREKEGELDRVQGEEKRAKEEEDEMDREEHEFLLDHFERSAELTRQNNALKSAKTQLLLSQNLLRHLESTNVWNDAFHIGNTPLTTDGKNAGAGITVGTINGLRLGGRPVVEWDEINAAWGLVALCVDRIAAKIGCVFEQHKIVPMGSTSRIEELPPGKNHYELFAASDLNILHNRRFSNGLVLLLDCIRQLIEYGRKLDRGWATGGPEIHKDKISGHSLRLPGLAGAMPTLPSMSIMGLGGSASASGSRSGDGRDRSGRKDEGTAEEQWTRACRAVLWALKRILVVESEADRQDAMDTAPR